MQLWLYVCVQFNVVRIDDASSKTTYERQILTPSPTKPVADAKRARIIWNLFHEFVPNRNQHSIVEKVKDISAIK